MIIAIHQPEFLPWLGFFDKMARVDAYVVFDHVQFKKRYFENRNRIRQDNEAAWVTVPVKSKGRYEQAINEVEIDNDSPWQKRIWEKIRHCYASSPCFAEISGEIEQTIFAGRYESLMAFNLAFIELFRRLLKIETPLSYSSGLGVEEFKGSDLILEICRRTGADKYLCGPSGKDYLDLDAFRHAGIEVCWQEFTHPQYPQGSEDFIPYLSTLDLLCNCGRESRAILLGENGILPAGSGE